MCNIPTMKNKSQNQIQDLSILDLEKMIKKIYLKNIRSKNAISPLKPKKKTNSKDLPKRSKPKAKAFTTKKGKSTKNPKTNGKK